MTLRTRACRVHTLQKLACKLLIPFGQLFASFWLLRRRTAPSGTRVNALRIFQKLVFAGVRTRHAWERALLLPDDAIQAQGSGAGRHQVQKDETIEHRQFATVRDRPEPVRKMLLEVGYGHFSAQQKCHRPRE